MPGLAQSCSLRLFTDDYHQVPALISHWIGTEIKITEKRTLSIGDVEAGISPDLVLL